MAEWRLLNDKWNFPAREAAVFVQFCMFLQKTCVCVCRAWLVRVLVGSPSRAHELDLIHAGAYGVFTHRAECVCCVLL